MESFRFFSETVVTLALWIFQQFLMSAVITSARNIILQDLKVSEQYGTAARKGNQLGMIRRNITYREKKLMVPIVGPHLEYCIQAWIPHLRKCIDKLAWVQRRATRMIPEMQTRCYEYRLKLCNQR